MKVLYHKRFDKSFDKLSIKLQHKVRDTLVLFIGDPKKYTLRNHSLYGSYQGFRSIDVTGDIRIIFRELSDGRYELVEIVDVGSHSQLYG